MLCSKFSRLSRFCKPNHHFASQFLHLHKCHYLGNKLVKDCLKSQATTLSRRFSTNVLSLGQPSGETEPIFEEAKTYIEEDVFVEGNDVPAPFLKFSDYCWPEKIGKFLEQYKFENPTAIQSQGMPICLEGRDLVGVAQTGSGKTLAYMLPALVHVDRELANGKSPNTPKSLILAPTRELVQQVEEVCRTVNYHLPVSFFGGASRNIQREKYIRQRPQIIVATPGRLNDFIDSQWVNLQDLTYLVLDEADRMLDIGFEPQIRAILNKLPTVRQTVMWTATWPEEVKGLAEEFMSNYIQINVGSKSLHANPNIHQNVLVCKNFDKDQQLLNVMDEIMRQDEDPNTNKIIIFAKTKSTVDRLPRRVLSPQGWHAFTLHGDKSQSARNGVMEAFRRGQKRILIATDIAARGLDVRDIKYVINYDMPNVIEDYVHRIGRAGRHGRKGVSYALFTEEDARLARDFVSILKLNNQDIPPLLEEWSSLPKSYFKNVRKQRNFGKFSNMRRY